MMAFGPASDGQIVARILNIAIRAATKQLQIYRLREAAGRRISHDAPGVSVSDGSEENRVPRYSLRTSRSRSSIASNDVNAASKAAASFDSSVSLTR